MLNKIFIKIDQIPHPPKSSKFMTKNNNIIELFICDNHLYRKSQKSQKITVLDSSLRYQIKHEQTSIILRLEKDDIYPIEYLFLDRSEPWEKILKSTLPQLDYQTYYELEKLIGSGSFASVYIGRRKCDNTKVAIKAFLKKMLIQKDPNGWRKSIENEIRIMKSLNHPSLLNFYDHYENRAQSYIVLELARGGTLEAGLKKLEEPLPFLTVKVIFKQIVEAIKHMHDRGIMHRDLKPSNILLKKPMALKQFSLIAQPEPNIVVSDFGVSTEITQNENQYCGSPGFMAPEIFICESNKNAFYNQKCDIFSLGCIFYRLITNKSLFNGVNSMQMKQLNKECNLDWNIITDELYGNKSLTNLLMKMLSLDPTKRPSCDYILESKILAIEYDNAGCPLFINYKKPKSQSIQVKTARNLSKSNCRLPQVSPNIAKPVQVKRSSNLLLPPIRLQTEHN